MSKVDFDPTGRRVRVDFEWRREKDEYRLYTYHDRYIACIYPDNGLWAMELVGTSTDYRADLREAVRVLECVLHAQTTYVAETGDGAHEAAMQYHRDPSPDPDREADRRALEAEAREEALES